MALVFGAANTDKVTVSAAASIDDLTTWTVAQLVYPTTLTGGRAYFNKSSGTGGSHGTYFYVKYSPTSDLRLDVSYSTSWLGVVSSSTPMTVNSWHWIVVTFDDGASPQGRIFHGSLTSPLAEVSYSEQTDGVGTLDADNDADFLIGQTGTSPSQSAFQGSIAITARWNRVLTLGELQSFQFRPRPTAGCVGYYVLGSNGTTNVPDWSGAANAGAISGPTLGIGAPVALFDAPSDVPYAIAAAAAASRRHHVTLLGAGRV